MRKEYKNQESSTPPSETKKMTDNSLVKCDKVTGDKGDTDPGVRETTVLKRNMCMRKTFASVYDGHGVSVSDRVREFSRMKKCLISSGYCNLHNMRVRREVKVKKMSTRDKGGEMKWVMGEVTVLVCPIAPTPNGINSETEDTLTILPEAGITNKRLRSVCDDEINQSAEWNPV